MYWEHMGRHETSTAPHETLPLRTNSRSFNQLAVLPEPSSLAFSQLTHEGAPEFSQTTSHIFSPFPTISRFFTGTTCSELKIYERHLTFSSYSFTSWKCFQNLIEKLGYQPSQGQITIWQLMGLVHDDLSPWKLRHGIQPNPILPKAIPMQLSIMEAISKLLMKLFLGEIRILLHCPQKPLCLMLLMPSDDVFHDTGLFGEPCR